MATFLTNLWKGATRNVGTWLGGAVGGPMGALVGGMVQQAAGGAGPAAAAGGTASPLTQWLANRAYWRAFRTELGLGQQPQTYSVGRALSRRQQQWGGMEQALAEGSQRPSGLSQAPPVQGWGQFYNDGLGLGGGGGGRGGGFMLGGSPRQRRTPTIPAAGAAAPTQPTPLSTAQIYQDLLRRSMLGYGGLPQQVYQSAAARGMGAINAQAAASQQALSSLLGQRGLLSSGLYGGGLSDIERSRLGAVSQLYGGLEEQGLAAARQAQQQAMELYLQQLLPSVQARAARPTLADYLGQLAGGYVQYKYAPQAPDYNALLGQIFGGSGTISSSPTPGSYSGLPYGFLKGVA